MTPHEQVAERTEAVEAAFYRLLDECDRYRATVEELLAAEEGSELPREQLVHRLRMLSGRMNSIIRILEDDALNELLPVLDRLFTIERAEQGIDI